MDTSSNNSSDKTLNKPRSNSRTHWERLDALSDGEIDTSDITPLTEGDFARSVWRLPAGMKMMKLLEDSDKETCPSALDTGTGSAGF